MSRIVMVSALDSGKRKFGIVGSIPILRIVLTRRSIASWAMKMESMEGNKRWILRFTAWKSVKQRTGAEASGSMVNFRHFRISMSFECRVSPRFTPEVLHFYKSFQAFTQYVVCKLHILHPYYSVMCTVLQSFVYATICLEAFQVVT